MDDKIILIIENETPLRSDILGDLFTAFARDYRDLTRGCTLVVARLEQGSTLIEWTAFALTTAGHYLKEAGEAAKGIKSLGDFATLLKSLFVKKKQETPARQVPRRRKKPGDVPQKRSQKLPSKTDAGCVSNGPPRKAKRSNSS